VTSFQEQYEDLLELMLTEGLGVVKALCHFTPADEPSAEALGRSLCALFGPFGMAEHLLETVLAVELSTLVSLPTLFQSRAVAYWVFHCELQERDPQAAHQAYAEALVQRAVNQVAPGIHSPHTCSPPTPAHHPHLLTHSPHT
jgi:hypothetical protein